MPRGRIGCIDQCVSHDIHPREFNTNDHGEKEYGRDTGKLNSRRTSATSFSRVHVSQVITLVRLFDNEGWK